MKMNQTKEAQELINGINRARTEIHNLQANTELSEWERNKREFELCTAIDLMKSSMVELMTRVIESEAHTVTLKAA